jgi:hypothetical protein
MGKHAARGVASLPDPCRWFSDERKRGIEVRMRYKYVAIADQHRLRSSELKRKIGVRAAILAATDLEFVVGTATGRAFPLVSFVLDADDARAALALAHEVALPLLPSRERGEYGEVVVKAESLRELPSHGHAARQASTPSNAG